MNRYSFSILLILWALIGSPVNTYANLPDTTKPANDFRFFGSITNNGISLIPSFSLGKPAAIAEFQVGRRYTFEPQFRFALEGKPWSFIFWNRYKVVRNEKFQMTAGAHPAFLFATKTITENGSEKEVITTKRFLAGELAPNFSLSKRISTGLYYLYSYGFDEGVKNTNMISFKAGFNSIPLFSGLTFSVVPQLYYLKMDEKDGFYFTSAFILARPDFPLSLSSVINKIIKSDIEGKDFIWNVTLTYTFSRKYREYKP
jgi:hypothetical protein